MQRCDCASVQLRKGNHAPQSLFALALAVLMFVSPRYAFPLLNLQAAQVASPLQNAGALIQQGQFEQARATEVSLAGIEGQALIIIVSTLTLCACRGMCGSFHW